MLRPKRWTWRQKRILSLWVDGLTPLSAKLAMCGESLALERLLKSAKEERNAYLQVLEDGGWATHATFTRDGCRSGESPRIRDMRPLESPGTTNQSRSRIRQPRRATGDSGLYLYYYYYYYLKQCWIPLGPHQSWSVVYTLYHPCVQVIRQHANSQHQLWSQDKSHP